jgi:hypothetical protein
VFTGSSEAGWTADPLISAPFHRGTITADGWRSDDDGTNSLLAIFLTFDSPRDIASIRVKGFNASAANNNIYQGFYVDSYDGSRDLAFTPTDAFYDITVDATSLTNVTTLYIDTGLTFYRSTASTIQEVTICSTPHV